MLLKKLYSQFLDQAPNKQARIDIIAARYKGICYDAERLLKHKEETKQELLEEVNYQAGCYQGVTVCKVEEQTTYDWKKIVEDLKLEQALLEQYKKTRPEGYRLLVEREVKK